MFDPNGKTNELGLPLESECVIVPGGVECHNVGTHFFRVEMSMSSSMGRDNCISVDSGYECVDVAVEH